MSKKKTEDFCFKLNSLEFKNLRFQNVTSSYGERMYLPYVYTEHGIIALASVLKSDIATQMSVKLHKLVTRQYNRVTKIHLFV